MPTLNVKKTFGSDDPVWVLLAELSLREFLSDQDRSDEPAAGSLFQTLQEFRMSPECMEHIAGMLAGLAKEASLRTKPGKIELPGRIRIFCQKKILDDVKSVKTSGSCHPEQPEKQKQSFPDSGGNKIGGWGYFMIERGEDLPPDSSAIPHNFIDLYLYKEGE